MANTSAIRQEAIHTTYHLASPSCSAGAMQKAYLFTRNVGQSSGIKSGEWAISRKMARQKEQEDWAETGSGEMEKRDPRTEVSEGIAVLMRA